MCVCLTDFQAEAVEAASEKRAQNDPFERVIGRPGARGTPLTIQTINKVVELARLFVETGDLTLPTLGILPELRAKRHVEHPLQVDQGRFKRDFTDKQTEHFLVANIRARDSAKDAQAWAEAITRTPALDKESMSAIGVRTNNNVRTVAPERAALIFQDVAHYARSSALICHVSINEEIRNSLTTQWIDQQVLEGVDDLIRKTLDTPRNRQRLLGLCRKAELPTNANPPTKLDNDSDIDEQPERSNVESKFCIRAASTPRTVESSDARHQRPCSSSDSAIFQGTNAGPESSHVRHVDRQGRRSSGSIPSTFASVREA